VKRSLVVLALALALPAVILAGGWLLASRNERASKLDAESLRAARALAAAREAVAGGLEALRAREDERPFYLYNHFYSPPEVLAVSDPVAVSPLAAEPSDPRVIGWFQIEPDGTVRTPREIEAIGRVRSRERATATATATETETRDAVSARLLRLAGSEAFDDLRALVAASEGALVVRATPRVSEVSPATPTRRMRSRAAVVAASEPVAPPNQVTVSLNTIDNLLADEIRRAQAGDPEALEWVTQRGRAAPITRRETTDLATIQSQQAAFQSSNVGPPNVASANVASANVASANVASANVANANVANVETTNRPPRVARARDAVEAPDGPGVSLTPVEIDVQYTPMTWRDRSPRSPRSAGSTADRSARSAGSTADGGDVLALARVVSHEGAAVAQVVALDRARVEAWVDEIVARATAGSDVTVRRADHDARCLHEARADTFPSTLRLCVAPDAHDALAARLDETATKELALSISLLALVMLAVVASLRAIRREEELSRARSDFVTAVSHELRTPLTTLRMHAEMLADGLVPEARRGKVHHELVRETQRLSRLVENVLETSRLEAGRRVVTRAPTDVVARAREVLEGFRELATSRDATVTLQAPEHLRVDVDADAFERILVNLVDNALKYGLPSEGPRTIEVSLGASSAATDDAPPSPSEDVSLPSDARPEEVAPPKGVVLRVSDRGPGVSPADRERVFRRFVRAARADATHRPGTGLGLALVRELARAHGGDARLEAREGGGTRVVVELS
jgi:signal transduction histidine kinase